MAVKKKPKKKQNAALRRAQDFVVDGSEFELGKVIGSGSFASVHIAVHTPTGKVWAVKRLDRARPDQEKLVSEYAQHDIWISIIYIYTCIHTCLKGVGSEVA